MASGASAAAATAAVSPPLRERRLSQRERDRDTNLEKERLETVFHFPVFPISLPTVSAFITHTH